MQPEAAIAHSARVVWGYRVQFFFLKKKKPVDSFVSSSMLKEVLGLGFRVKGLGLYGDNGKDNGNYNSTLGLYWDNGKMEAAIAYWGYYARALGLGAF